MRDLNLNELEHVYGAGSCGRNNSPAPPSNCGGGGSQSKHSQPKASKVKGSRAKNSKGHGCYC